MFFLRRFRKKCRRKGCQSGLCERCISLEQGNEEKEYQIVCNPHRKSSELGLFNGNTIRVVRNHDFQNNIIVAVGESRYILSKDIAKSISIQEIA